MKKILAYPLFLFIVVFFINNKVSAIGQIEVTDFPESINALVGQQLNSYISFYYSGLEYKPIVSLSSKSGFPEGLQMSPAVYEGGGLYNALYSGVPKSAGVYDLTLTITDGQGALFVKKLKVNVNRLNFLEKKLPNGYVGKEYIQKIKYEYPGKGDLRMTISNLPQGLYNIDSNPNPENGYFTLKLTPSRAGNFNFNTDVVLNNGAGTSNINVGSDVFNLTIEEQNSIKIKVEEVSSQVIQPEKNEISTKVNKLKDVLKIKKQEKVEPKEDISVVKNNNVEVLLIQDSLKKEKWYKRIFNFFKRK